MNFKSNYPKVNGQSYDPNKYINNGENSVKIKTIPNTSAEIGYEWGNKDPWAVYVIKNNTRFRPMDEDYFKYLKEIADTYGTKTVMNDFLNIYNKTTDTINYSVLNDDINKIADKYNKSTEYKANVNRLFTILYLTMIAEFHYVTENGIPSILKKKIKLIGVWHVLFDNKEPRVAANWSKHKSARKELIPEYNRAATSLYKNGFKM